jgi:hypothetical protein
VIFRLEKTPLFYDGTQLHGGFARERYGLEGDSLVAFIGGARVEGEALVDLEDRAAGRRIVAARMLHFIAEHPGASLEVVTLRQRLLVESARSAAEEMMAAAAARPRRRGNDIYVGDGKLSVSVATTSLSSGLIHLGVNIDPAGAPVRTASLPDLGIEPEAFAREVFRRYNDELEGVRASCAKVRPVD